MNVAKLSERRNRDNTVFESTASANLKMQVQLAKDPKDWTNEDFPWIGAERWAEAHRILSRNPQGWSSILGDGKDEVIIKNYRILMLKWHTDKHDKSSPPKQQQLDKTATT